jgi:glycosyltransferase involved in cell wall biosynthesis
VYNEEACIDQVVRELHDVLSASSLPGWEIMAVDDGSTDGTPTHLDRLRAALPGLRVVRLAPNAGQSAAFAAGFARAAGEILVTMDADGQSDPADIPRLVEALGDGDCCCGHRVRRQDRWSRRVGSRMANRVRNAVLGEDILDTGCSLKAFRAALTRDLPVWNGMHRFFPALFRIRGATIRQIPVHHRPRLAGRSKYTNLGRLATTVWDLWAVRWMQRRAVTYHATEAGE